MWSFKEIVTVLRRWHREEREVSETLRDHREHIRSLVLSEDNYRSAHGWNIDRTRYERIVDRTLTEPWWIRWLFLRRYSRSSSPEDEVKWHVLSKVRTASQRHQRHHRADSGQPDSRHPHDG